MRLKESLTGGITSFHLKQMTYLLNPIKIADLQIQTTPVRTTSLSAYRNPSVPF